MDDHFERTSDMARLIALMNGDNVASAPKPTHAGIAAPITAQPDTAHYMADMGRLMSAFNESLDSVHETSKVNPQFNLALNTEKTDTGVRMGSWLIEKNGKTYDVIHAASNDIIAKDIFLYEAAEKLVDALNEGKTINSDHIREILECENMYSKNIMDARKYLNRMKTLTEGAASHDVANARYSDARSKAIMAKSRLSKLS